MLSVFLNVLFAVPGLRFRGVLESILMFFLRKVRKGRSVFGLHRRERIACLAASKGEVFQLFRYFFGVLVLRLVFHGFLTTSGTLG